ncbi:transport between ER and Golgi ATPase protein [Mycoemilia scoparia]|uniref:Vesicular-fusion protein SEC18 n=1 Tax=Mycoemilia scoparia TaxID=417184 RepID=A0A9W8DR60_9FUNG|nr:transport between ER and Golgi ATPase protein [Mycoemilia scoparia]
MPSHHGRSARGSQHRQPSQGGGVYSVVKAPDKTMALKNLLFMNPKDARSIGAYGLLDDRFVFTIGMSDMVEPSTIAPNAFQRVWADMDFERDVHLTPFDPFRVKEDAYIGEIIIQVSFVSRKNITDKIDGQEIAKVVKGYQRHVLSLGQIFAISVPYTSDSEGGITREINLRCTVTEIKSVGEKGAGQQKGQSHFGIMFEESDVVLQRDPESGIQLKNIPKSRMAKSLFKPNFKFEDLGIGGLDDEFNRIFRRAFASRIYPPSMVEKLGVQHVKGVLLYGPPGTGKTLMARQIGKMLQAHEPIVVNGPEILNKYVGESENNIRKLFGPAEKEYKEKGDDSQLHIIIFDELDAICRQRGTKNDGTGTGDSVVNQLLSKIDGVDQLNNVLLIGMTNRKDMIDDALLRPGRLEVQIEVGLPDEAGRLQILNIHTSKIRNNGMLENDVDLLELAELTKNFSGAEIAGLVKSASSFAFNRHVKVGDSANVAPDFEDMRVKRDDFMNALNEVKPAFGVADEELVQYTQYPIIKFDRVIDTILNDGRLFVEQVKTSERSRLFSVLLYGPPGSGKTSLAARIGMDSDYPFVKIVSPESMVGFTENAKINAINKVFNDSYKSPLSIVVVDNIERLLEWVPIGPRFSNGILQALLVLLKKQPPNNRRLLILATTSQRGILHQMGMDDAFNDELYIPNIKGMAAFKRVLESVEMFDEDELVTVITELKDVVDNKNFSIAVKKLLLMIETAKKDDNPTDRFIDDIKMLAATSSSSNDSSAGNNLVGY